MEERTDRFTALEDRFAGYAVYDPAGEKIGKVDDLFVDQADEPEYVGVKMGFLGTRSTLIPWDAVSTADDEGRSITVDIDKDKAKNGPTFDDDREITPEFEDEVYSYYGLESSAENRGAYGDYYGDTTTNGQAGPGMTMGDREGIEFHEHSPPSRVRPAKAARTSKTRMSPGCSAPRRSSARAPASARQAP